MNRMVFSLGGDPVHSVSSEVMRTREVLEMVERKLDVESRDMRLNLGSKLWTV